MPVHISKSTSQKRNQMKFKYRLEHPLLTSIILYPVSIRVVSTSVNRTTGGMTPAPHRPSHRGYQC